MFFNDMCKRFKEINGEWIEVDFKDIRKGDIIKIITNSGLLLGKYRAKCDPYISMFFNEYEIALEEIDK